MSSLRNHYLDYIRAIAISLVFSYHFFTRLDVTQAPELVRFFRAYGSLGVDIFFPLSGYLITRALITVNSASSLKVFFIRRVFRILPLYLVAVSLYVIASLLTGHDLNILGNIWIVMLLMTGWGIFLCGLDEIPYTLTWSISVEEFSYIVLGVWAWVTNSLLSHRRAFECFVLLLTIAAILLRLYLHNEGYSRVALYYFPLTRLDSVFIGSLAAIWSYRESKPIIRLTLMTLLLWLLALIHEDFELLLYSAIASATSVLIVSFERIPQKGTYVTADNLAVRIGVYSYGIYLFHFFVIEAVLRAMGLTQTPYDISLHGPAFILSALVTYFICKISFEHFEKKIIDYSRTFKAD